MSGAERFPLLVPGASGAGRLEVEAPFDGSVIASVETADAAGAERIGPGSNGGSDACGVTLKNLFNTCGH